MDRRKAIDMAVSVIAAVILWVYVINIVNPQTNGTLRQVPVQITGQDQLKASGLALSKVPELYVDLDITGARNEVKNVKPADIQASVDVSKLVLGENEAPVAIRLPGGISLDENDALVMAIVTEEYVTQPKPVSVALTGAGAGQEETLVRESLSQINVSGAKSLVEKVAAVKVEADISSYGLDTAAELTLATKAVDGEGNPVDGAEPSQSEISVVVAIFQTKTVPLSVALEGAVWEGATVLEKTVPSEITIKGPAEMLSQISSVEGKSVDISGVYEDSSFDIQPVLPKGVFAAKDSEQLHVVLNISEDGSLSFEYPADGIGREGLKAGLNAQVSVGASSIQAKVMGPVSVLRTLAPGDVTPSISLDGLGTGDFFLPLLPSRKIEGVRVDYSPATVSVRIKTE